MILFWNKYVKILIWIRSLRENPLILLGNNYPYSSKRSGRPSMHDGIPDLLFFFIYAAWNLPSRLQISSNSLSFCLASGLKSSGTCILTTAYWSPWSDGSFKETIPLPRRRIFVPEWVPALILQTTSPYNVWTRVSPPKTAVVNGTSTSL